MQCAQVWQSYYYLPNSCFWCRAPTFSNGEYSKSALKAVAQKIKIRPVLNGKTKYDF
jgi:hypothetical protein